MLSSPLSSVASTIFIFWFCLLITNHLFHFSSCFCLHGAFGAFLSRYSFTSFTILLALLKRRNMQHTRRRSKAIYCILSSNQVNPDFFLGLLFLTIIYTNDAERKDGRFVQPIKAILPKIHINICWKYFQNYAKIGFREVPFYDGPKRKKYSELVVIPSPL